MFLSSCHIVGEVLGFFLLLGFSTSKTEQPLQDKELQEKEAKKD